MGIDSIFTGVMVIAYALVMGFSLVSYVLSAVGMYRIAKRRGIHHAWLAWIPVGMNWLLGSISDHYQYVAKQRITNRRKILVGLDVILLVISTACGVIAGVVGYMEFADGTAASIFTIVILIAAMLGVIGLSIANLVFCYIAYYDLFQSCRPGYAVPFLILGIFFTVTVPFFTFACSGYDQGMPPRRVQQPPVQIPNPPVSEDIIEAEIVDPEETGDSE